jgi:hypothetical protein
VDLLNLRVLARKGSTIGDMQVLRPAIPQRQSIKIASQPPQDEPSMHDLATEISAVLGKFSHSVRLGD